MRKTLDVEPGMMFAVPLESGGFGVAIVARVWQVPNRRLRIVRTFGFARKRWDRIPELAEVEHFTIDHSHVFNLAGDGMMRKKMLPLIGMMPGFLPEHWPFPPIASGWPYELRKPPDKNVTVFLHGDEDVSAWGEFHFPGPIEFNDFKRLPAHAAFGYGDSGYLAAALDVAIDTRDRYQYNPSFKGRFELWCRVVKAIFDQKPEARKIATIWSKIVGK